MSTERDPIHLTPEQLSLLAQWSAQTGKPADQVLNDALRSYRPAERTIASSIENATPRSFADRMTRLGLLGCFRDGPEDLSTNPEHMKGFGE